MDIVTALMNCDLHVCGDDPKFSFLIKIVFTVISTYVEMILKYDFPLAGAPSDLHVCGDDPVPAWKTTEPSL